MDNDESDFTRVYDNPIKECVCVCVFARMHVCVGLKVKYWNLEKGHGYTQTGDKLSPN